MIHKINENRATANDCEFWMRNLTIYVLQNKLFRLKMFIYEKFFALLWVYWILFFERFCITLFGVHFCWIYFKIIQLLILLTNFFLTNINIIIKTNKKQNCQKSIKELNQPLIIIIEYELLIWIQVTIA